MRFLLIPFLLCALSGFSQSTITTALVTVTNTAGTTNGQTITVNGDVRTWTNSVFNTGTQVLTNSTGNGAATNLFNHISVSPFNKIFLSWSATNAISLQGVPGLSVVVTLSAGWGTVTFTTNTLTSAVVVRMPISVEAAGQQTNIASMLALALDESTNSLSGADPLLANYVGITNKQTITGTKTFASFSGTAGSVTNGGYLNPTSTNGVNYGNAFASYGSGVNSLQLGNNAQATATLTVAAGYSANATAGGAAAVGAQSLASASQATALGDGSTASAANSTAAGFAATANGPNSTALGDAATTGATHTNSTAIGYNAATTAANQIMLGSSGVSAVVNNYLSVGGGATFASGTTNQWSNGTNTFLPGSDVAFTRYPVTTLANGNNAAVAVGTNVFVEVSGPSGAFTINGINGGPNRDGKLLIILNLTGQNMTIAHDSGVDPTAGNRIYTMTGADRATTANGAAMLIYSANSSRWILFSFDP